MPERPFTDDALRPWPSFLDLLDSDPKGALEGFYRLASNCLGTVPPRPMRGIPKQDIEDYFHEFALSCCENGFAKLRRYQNQGRPFAGWLWVVAHRFALDWRRRYDPPADVDNMPEQATDPKPEKGLLLGKVLEMTRQLSEKCRLLLKLAGEGFTPMEMAIVMGWGPDQNAKASDDLRYCRRKLVEKLADSGVDIEREIGNN